MNIFEMENMVKGLPDEILQRELASPSDPGRFPQWLTMSEVMRRKSMRESFQAKNAPQGTVKDQVMQGGIAAAMPQGPQGGPPMGPPPGPQGAPVAAYGGGRMPYRMADGGPVPTSGGYGPPSFYGSFGPELIGGPDRLQRQFGSTMKPSLIDYTDPAVGEAFKTMRDTPEDIPDAAYQQMFVNQFSGLRAPTGGAYGGGAGGGLEYGGPTNYFMPFSFSSMDRKKPTVTVEEIPETGMAGGGYIPGTVFMQQGQTVPGTNPAIRDLNARIAGALMPRRAQFSVIREAKALRDQGKVEEAVSLLTQEGIDPRQALGDMPSAAPPMPAAPAAAAVAAPAAPTSAVNAPPQDNAFDILNVTNALNQNRLSTIMGSPASTPAAAPAAAPAADMTGANVDISTLFPQARGVIGGRGSGMPSDLAGAMKPYEDILAVDPNAAVFKGPDFAPLIEEQRKRGAERAASYEQTIKGIENEMKRERLGAVLTTLGANLMAGEGALGLEKAGALAQQIGKETRQEIAAERRAARTAEDATADRIFALNAQQLTGDKEAQRALYTAQRGVKEKALEFLQKDIGNRQQAEQAANQLAATLTVSMVNSIRDKVVSEGADRRSALSFAQSLAKEQLEILSANPQLAAMPREDLQSLINQTMRAALETAFSAVGTALPPTFNVGATSGGTPAPSGPRAKPLSAFGG